MLADPAGRLARPRISLWPGVSDVLPRPRAGSAWCSTSGCRRWAAWKFNRRLAEEGIDLPIIFITAHGDVPTCARAIKAGALDFLEKPLDGKVLLDHVRKALAREAEQKRQGPATEFAARIARLTPSEKDVLEMLISGKSLKTIAILSNVTVQTIWKHRLSIHKKMGVDNDVQLVRLATKWANDAPVGTNLKTIGRFRASRPPL